MGFSDDEKLLNSINLDSIQDYKQFVEQLRPLLIQDSGYTEIENTSGLAQIANAQKALDQAKQERAALKQQINEAKRTGDTAKLAGLKKELNKYTDPKGIIAMGEKELLSRQANIPRTTLQKSQERLAMESRFKALQEAELKQLEEQAAYLGTPEAKAEVERARALQKAQQEQALAFTQRQKDAIEGKIGNSPVVQKKIQDEFNLFKEAQARAGNTILGDTVDNAAAKGSGAQSALESFKSRIDELKQREIDSIVNQTPLGLASSELANGLYGQGRAVGTTGQFSSPAFSRAYSLPTSPDYSGISGLSLSGQQPFQFNRQLALQRDMFNAQMNQSQGSGKSGLIGGLLGAGVGAYFGGPLGASVGYNVGQGAGTLFS